MPGSFTPLLLALSAVWIAFEVALVALRRAAPATSRDAGTVRWAGLGAIGLGLAFRLWAILVLGRAFTVAVAEASWIGAAVILVPITLAFLQRIAVEERALAGAFPAAYPDYAARTWRLVPWVY